MIKKIYPAIEDVAASRKGIQSLEIGLRVAEVLAQSPTPLPLREVARASGLAGGAAHRYLVSLIRAGLASQTADGRYEMGGLALRLGFAALARLDPMQVAEAQLASFVETTGTTAMLTLWCEQGPIVMRWTQGVRPVYTTIALGSVMPLSTSATGLVFLAWMDAQQRDRIMKKLTKVLSAELRAKWTKVKEVGFAMVTGDLVPGLYAAAAPVFDGRGNIFAAFTAVDVSPLPADVVATLREASTLVSAELGYTRSGKSN